MRMARLILFEQHVEDHGPLARTRPVFELRCGSLSLGDRITAHYEGVIVHHQARDYLAAVHEQMLAERGVEARVNAASEALDDDVLFVDGALLATGDAAMPALRGPDELGLIREVANCHADDNGDLVPEYRQRRVYLRLGRDRAQALLSRVGANVGAILDAASVDPSIVKRQLDDGEVRVMTHPWHLIEHNGAAVTEDFERYRRTASNPAAVDPSTAYLQHGRRVQDGGGPPGADVPVFLGAATTVGAFVSFDVSEGPIIVGDDVTIESHCHFKGPAFVGNGSTVWAFADVKENCSLGPRSRVCGQIEEVVFHGYMHKFHVGFVGHSYLGEGVNVGDQTVTSNLKNDRTPVVVHLSPDPRRHINTGSLYCGSLIGDGAATGTNTNLTTGAVVEPLSSVVSAGATPKYVNGFLYNGRHLPSPFTTSYGAYRILVEERLGRPLPAGNEALFRRVYDSMKATRRRLRRPGTKVRPRP